MGIFPELWPLGEGGGDTPFVPVPGATAFSGLFPITRRGGETVLYLSRPESNKVQIMNPGDDGAGVSNGLYYSRPLLGREQKIKRVKRFTQFGQCEGSCTATLTVVLDKTREITFSLTGPYDADRNILFYQEFLSDEADGREVWFNLESVTGIDVRPEKQMVEFTEVD